MKEITANNEEPLEGVIISPTVYRRESYRDKVMGEGTLPPYTFADSSFMGDYYKRFQEEFYDTYVPPVAESEPFIGDDGKSYVRFHIHKDPPEPKPLKDFLIGGANQSSRHNT